MKKDQISKFPNSPNLNLGFRFFLFGHLVSLGIWSPARREEFGRADALRFDEKAFRPLLRPPARGTAPATGEHFA